MSQSATLTASSEPTTVDRARLVLAFCLTVRSLRKGQGDAVQLSAFHELEWRLCAQSFVYFLVNYCFYAPKSGRTVKPFIPWPTQIRMAQRLQDGENICAVKARQLGFTTLVMLYFLWLIMFRPAVKAYVLSISEPKAKEAMTRLHPTLMRLPRWMKERGNLTVEYADTTGQPSRLERGITTTRRSKLDGLSRIRFGMSEIVVLTSTPESAQGLSGFIFLDEFAKHPHQDEVYEHVLPVIDDPDDPAQCIIAFNGNGMNKAHDIYQAAKKGDNRFSAVFCSWRWDPRRDKAWYEAMKRDYLGKNKDKSLDAFRVQYPTFDWEAFIISAQGRFNKRTVTWVRETIVDPPFTGMLERDSHERSGWRFEPFGQGSLDIWAMPAPGKVYVGGIDAAGGAADGDWATITMAEALHGPKGEQVAEYRARIEPAYLAMVSQGLAEFYNNAFLVPELNNHGLVLVDRLKDDYANIYRRMTHDRVTDEIKEQLGWSQDRSSKHMLIDTLAEFLAKRWFIIRSQRTMEELAVFERKTNGSLGAKQGFNDDLVISGGLAVIGCRDVALQDEEVPVIEFDQWSW